jgi:hypothetical protein
VILSQRALNRAFLARQMLLKREKIKVLPAIERLVALQAQLARPPLIALWSRLENFRAADLAKADVVRATMMRGTLHLMSRRDYIAFRPAMQPMLNKLVRRGAEVDLDDARKFFRQPRTFDAFREHLLARDPKCDERAIAYAVRLQLPLSQSESGDFTFFDQPLSADSTPHALALRYFAAFGPATVADLQSWTGLQSLRNVVKELDLVTFKDENGRELLDLSKAPRPSEDVEAPVRLLPDFDNAVLGHADRSRIIDDKDRAKVVTKNLRVLPTFLVDGRVAGTWSLEKKNVKLEPFGKLRAADRAALEEESERLAQFLTPL